MEHINYAINGVEMWAAALVVAVAPGWAVFNFCRYFVGSFWNRYAADELLDSRPRSPTKLVSSPQESRDTGLIAPEAVVSAFFQLRRVKTYDQELKDRDKFYLGTVISAFCAASTCLAAFAITIVVARYTLREYTLQEYNSILEMTGGAANDVARRTFRIFLAPITVMLLIWVSVQFRYVAKIVVSNAMPRRLIYAYLLLYLAMSAIPSGMVPFEKVVQENPTVGVNGASRSGAPAAHRVGGITGVTTESDEPSPGSRITILNVVSYGFVSMLRHVMMGPIFIATEVAKSSLLEQMLRFLFLFLIIFCTLKYVTFIVLELYKRKSGAESFDLTAIGVVLSGFVWLLSILLSVSTLKIDAVAIGIFTALVGAGVSISFRDLLNNFFSGILLNLDKSIKKGDVIRTADGTMGEVNQISLRYTHLQTKDLIDILIPNSALVQNRFENLTRSKEEVRLTLGFSLGQNIDIEQVERIVLKACRYVPEVSAVADRSPALFYQGPSERGHRFDLRFWVNDPRPGSPKLQSDVAKAIFKQLRRLNVELPMIYNMNITVDEKQETGSASIEPPDLKKLTRRRPKGPKGEGQAE